MPTSTSLPPASPHPFTEPRTTSWTSASPPRPPPSPPLGPRLGAHPSRAHLPRYRHSQIVRLVPSFHYRLHVHSGPTLVTGLKGSRGKWSSTISPWASMTVSFQPPASSPYTGSRLPSFPRAASPAICRATLKAHNTSQGLFHLSYGSFAFRERCV